ncbi:MAG: bifunctional riboflavin kinase/FAD synthetase [Sedimentisphaerales bacterium]|nr:bifunctional riboflavin kinase/FAD synthetase [Sedimentisphaerales bacterium]
MRIYDSIEALGAIEKKTALTIGNFDGVHRGHKKILQAARKAAVECDASGVAVMTFDPHPLAILHPDRAPGILTPLPLKIRLLEDAGVDCLIIIKDSYAMLNLSPENFVDSVLMESIRPRVIIEGPNFHFGYGRSGNINTLRDLGIARGFSVVVVEAEQMKHIPVANGICSSTLIRRFIEDGRVAEAGRLLSRPYRLMGWIIAGRGIGRTLGFPTANINPLRQIVPAEGVYAGYVQIGDTIEEIIQQGKLLPSVFSIGRAKTFVSDHPLLLEAHILEGDVPDLYGKSLAMDFVDRIRSQQRFEDHATLAAQIARDCHTARTLLGETSR